MAKHLLKEEPARRVVVESFGLYTGGAHLLTQPCDLILVRDLDQLDLAHVELLVADLEGLGEGEGEGVGEAR